MKPTYFLVPIAIAWLGCLLAGWWNKANVSLATTGDQLTASPDWTAWAPGIALGVLTAAAGAVLLFGGVARGKARRPAWMLLAIGLLWSAAAAVTGPFEASTASNQQIAFGEGVLGQGYTRRVPLADVERVEVYETRRRSRRGTGKGRRLVTMVEFHRVGGEVEYVGMSGPVRTELLRHVLPLLTERGVAVNDRRAPPE